jgi:hypothetical protein
MGGVASAIDDAVSDVGQAIGDVAQSVGGAVEQAIQSIGNIVQPIIKKIESDPIGSIATIAASATGQVWALPLISAADTIAHGGSLVQAAEGAAMSYVASNIASAVSGAILVPADSAVSIATNEATTAAAQGMTADEISNILQQTGADGVGGIPANIADSIANAAAAGVPQATLATAYAGAFGTGLDGVMTSATESILAGAAGNAVGAAAKSLVTTGSIDTALLSGLAAGVGTGIGGGITAGANDLGANSVISTVAGKVAGATAASAIGGQNVGATFVNSLINTSLSQIGGALKNTEVGQAVSGFLSSTGSSIASSINQGIASITNQQNAQQQYYSNTVTPAYQAAQSSYNDLTTANNNYATAYTSYQSDYSNYTDLRAQYAAAVASNDPGTANSLADRITAAETTLSNDTANLTTLQNAAVAAGNTYNSNYSAYDFAKNTYGQQTQAITDANTQLNDTATKAQAQIDNYATNVQTAVSQISGLSDSAKQAFYNSFGQNNSDPLASAQTAQTVNGMSDIAQSAFNTAFSQGQDTTAALQTASQVNSLSSANQEYYQFASDAGLNTTTALTVAPQLSGMTATAQQAFYDQVLNNKLDPTAALQTATQVNSMTDKQQSAFANATANGLNIDQATNVATTASMLGTNGQNAYIDAIKNSGGNQNLANILAAATQMLSPGAAVSSINAPSTLTDPNGIAVYNSAIASRSDSATALKLANEAIGLLTGSGNVEAKPTDTTSAAPSNIVQATYQPNGNGGWNIVVNGTIMGPAPMGGTVAPKIGEAAGVWYPVNSSTGKVDTGAMPVDPNNPVSSGAAPGTSSTATQGGSGTGNTTGSGALTTTIDPVTNNIVVTNNDGSKDFYDAQTGNLVKTVAAPSAPTLQDILGSLATKATTAAKGASSTATPTNTTGGSSPTATSTQPGGATTGGTGVGGGGTGTGTGGGGNGGTGTGIGGGGSGTGGGAGGTGTGTSGSYTYGTSGAGASATGTNPGITNLTGGLTGGKEITLIGEPTTQETVSPMQNQFSPQPMQTFATGGSATTDLGSGTYNPIGTTASTIAPLSGGVTKAQYAKLLGIPTINEASNPLMATQYSQAPIQSVQETVAPIHLAEGGLPSPTYNYNQTGFPQGHASFTRGKAVGLEGMPGHGGLSDMSGKLLGIPGHAEGGEIEEHNPEFFSEGGIHHFVQGGGTGTSDSVPAMLANGEFVLPADIVSGLGNGSNDAGAKVLDEFLKVIRAHKQSNNPKELPPDSKGPLGYLLEAKRKA